MRRNNNGQENEEFRIRFIEVTVKGSAATLQHAIRSVADAVGQRPSIAPPTQTQALPSGSTNGQQALDFDHVEEGEIEETSAPATPVKTQPKRNRSYATPQILHDLELKSGKVPFEDFCRKKNPNTDNKRYLVIAAWFKEHRNVNAVTTAHIYTCWRAMGWTNYPADFGKPFRSCKAQGWFKSTSDGSFEINHLGLDVVNKMGGG